MGKPPQSYGTLPAMACTVLRNLPPDESEHASPYPQPGKLILNLTTR